MTLTRHSQDPRPARRLRPLEGPHEWARRHVYSADTATSEEVPVSATHTILDSPVGALTLVAEDGALTGLYFRHHWYLRDLRS